MTMPKRQLKNQCVMLTRRTHQGRHWLLNDKQDTYHNISGYNYALAITRTNQQPHGVMTMSNHHHLIQTDPDATRSKFMQQFHQSQTRCINHQRDREDSLWSASAPGDMAILTTESIKKALLYTWLNPVKAGLVEKVDDWAHFTILPKHWGKPMTFNRPDYFSAKNKNIPPTITIVPMPPPGFQNMPVEKAISLFEGWIAEEEQRYAEKRKRTNASVEGMRRIYKQKPSGRPKIKRPRNKLNPRFACSHKKRSAAAIKTMRTFWSDYRRCMTLARANKPVTFPSGTLHMARFHDCLPVQEDDPHFPCFENYPPD